MRIKLQLIAVLLMQIFCSCVKDGDTGGKSSLTFYPTWQDSNRGNELIAFKGATVYLWFDGTTDGPNSPTPKDKSTADLSVTATSDETSVKVTGLKKGHYGWLILGTYPGAWKNYHKYGYAEIKSKNNRKNTNIDISMY